MQVGLVGLGAMGRGMAASLRRAGHVEYYVSGMTGAVKE